MAAWLDRFLQGDGVAVWTEMTSVEATIGFSDEEATEATAVAVETMRRCRANVEQLVDLLPSAGYRFIPGEGLATFRPPAPTVVADLARLETHVGPLPVALRTWYQEVGEVNLMGAAPGGWCDFPDPLVVQAPIEYTLAERSAWEQDRGTEWDRGAFVVDFSPDYLHKADVSGGAPYSIAVPQAGLDGRVLWERNQTSFVNYLRIAFAWGGFPGFAFADAPFPLDLREIAHQLLRI
jgi:hypothetical protein